MSKCWYKWYNTGTICSISCVGNKMLKISRLADYATIFMSVLAEHAQCVASAELALKTHINLPTVRKVMKLLLEAGLVTSVQGANGGYQLTKPADQMTIVEIIAAIDGLPAMTECAKHAGQCEQQSNCSLRGNWQQINRLVINVLDQVSLADMIKPMEQPLVFHAANSNTKRSQ